MRFTLLFGICLLAGLVYGQLIIDEDDPNSKKLIDQMMKAINEHEKSTYTFKSVVYSLPIGDQQKMSILLKVADSHGAIHSCTVELVGHGQPGQDNYATGPVQCKQ